MDYVCPRKMVLPESFWMGLLLLLWLLPLFGGRVKNLHNTINSSGTVSTVRNLGDQWLLAKKITRSNVGIKITNSPKLPVGLYEPADIYFTFHLDKR